MAGVTVIPVNRAICYTPSLVTSYGTAVAGYPITNLQNPDYWMQARVTPPGGNEIRIKFDWGAAPSSASDLDSTVTALFIGNHNIDGCGISFHRSSDDSSYTQEAAYTLDNYTGSQNLLVTFTGGAYRYWHLRITGAPNPTKLGVVSFGPHVDLGYALQGQPVGSEALAPGVSTAGIGYSTHGDILEPRISRTLNFRNPTAMAATNINKPDKSGSGNYIAYNTLFGAFESAWQYSLASITRRSGLSAGSGCPLAYRLDDANPGFSGAGRPAYYGRWNIDLALNAVRSNLAVLSVGITDELPRVRSVKPVNY